MRTLLYFTLCSIIILASCTKENESTPLELTSPVSGSDISHCCIDFDWSSPVKYLNYQFQLSSDAAFSTVLLDSTLIEKSISVDYLTPGKNYYWKVTSEGSGAEGKSIFSTVNYIDQYNGTYLAARNVHSFVMTVGSFDTTYITSIEIFENDKGQLAFDNFAIDYTHSPEPGLIHFAGPNNANEYVEEITTIDLNTNSFFYSSQKGGMGGSYKTTFEAILSE
ncbi:MAG: hypothetical protein ACJA1A_001703 [Saprospiraceae bacterium]|jgi:hypothetical protein